MYKSYLKTHQSIDCVGCSACAAICPQNCIEMVEDLKGFKMPKVNEKKCVDCKLCYSVCEHKIEINNDSRIFIGCYSKDKSVHENSTSGGFFMEMAKYVIEKYQGIVYGAAYDSDLNLKHIAVDDISELFRLQKTKYTQSNLEDVFHEIHKHLLHKKKILFSGLPCQVYSLISYLKLKKVSISNLITVDLICSGVPSPTISKRYFMEKYSNILKLDFRNKKNLWDNPTIKIETNSGDFFENYYDSDFQFLFSNGLVTRESCFKCNFAKIEHVSDFTIGDFWGIQDCDLEIYNSLGVSQVIIHSQKGMESFEELKDNLCFKKYTIEQFRLQDRLKNPPQLYGDSTFMWLLLKRFSVQKAIRIYRKYNENIFKRACMKIYKIKEKSRII